MKRKRPTLKSKIEKNLNVDTTVTDNVTMLSTRSGEGDNGSGNTGGDDNGSNNGEGEGEGEGGDNNDNVGGRPKPPMPPGTVITPPTLEGNN